MNANIIARIANVTRIANNAVVNNTPSAKEHNIMNAFKTIVTRAAQTVGLVALLSLSHTAVKADVVVDDWTPPSRVLNVPAGTTELQLKLYNDDNYSIRGAKVNITFWLGWSIDGLNFPVPGSETTVTTSPVNMTPYEDLWVSVTIPRTAPNGEAYFNNTAFNKTIFATIQSGASSFTISFQDVAPSANLQIASVKGPSNYREGTPFYAVVTNNGYAASTVQPITGSLWADAEGQVSPNYALLGSVPALQPGKSATVTFYMPTITTYGDTGYNDIKGYFTLDGEIQNFSF